MSGVAAATLAAAPAFAQQETAPEAGADQQTAEQQAPSGRSFQDTYGEQYAQWGDQTVEELVGTEVVNDEGETIGEIDDFGLAEDQLVAIVGVGGFLGLGEHQVAVPIDEFTQQDDQLLLSGVTREQLEEMPEYEEGMAEVFASDQTLSSGYEGGSSESAAVLTDDGEATDAEGAEMAEGTDESEPTTDGTDDAQMAEGEATDEAAQPETDMAEGEAADEPAQPETDMAEGEASDEPAQPETDMAEGEAADEPAQPETDMAEGEATDEPAQPETDMAEGEATDQAAQPQTDMAEGETTDQAAQSETDMAETDAAGEPAAEEAEMVEAESEGGWTEEMDSIFADIADREIAELIGMEVAGADGEIVGDVDNFALAGNEVVAVVGVGGFLGIGEHSVGLPLDEMSFDGERLVLSDLTEDQLRELPEFDEEQGYLPGDGTLRSTYDQ